VSVQTTVTAVLDLSRGVTVAVRPLRSGLHEAASSYPSFLASLSTNFGKVLQHSAPGFLFFAGSGNPRFEQQVSVPQLRTRDVAVSYDTDRTRIEVSSSSGGKTIFGACAWRCNNVVPPVAVVATVLPELGSKPFLMIPFAASSARCSGALRAAPTGCGRESGADPCWMEWANSCASRRRPDVVAGEYWPAPAHCQLFFNMDDNYFL
jgi:hypothetical protein